MIDMFFLVAREGFFQDLILPGIALIFVLALLGNAILNKFGWTLW